VNNIFKKEDFLLKSEADFFLKKISGYKTFIYKLLKITVFSKTIKLYCTKIKNTKKYLCYLI